MEDNKQLARKKSIIPDFDESADFENESAFKAFTAMRSSITSKDELESLDDVMDQEDSRKKGKSFSAIPQPRRMSKSRPVSRAESLDLSELMLNEDESSSRKDSDSKKKLRRSSTSKGSRRRSSSGLKNASPSSLTNKEALDEEFETGRQRSSSIGSFSSEYSVSDLETNTAGRRRMSSRLSVSSPPTIDETKTDENADEGELAQVPVKGERTVNVIEKMQEGTCLMKFGRLGSPHFRYFALTEDMMNIVFFSKGKTMSQTRLPVAAIESVRIGIGSSAFERHYYYVKDFKTTAFSMVYDGGKRSLDVIASSNWDFLIWTQGLNYLISKSDKRKNSSSDKTGELLELPDLIRRKMVTDSSKFGCRPRVDLAKIMHKLTEKLKKLEISLEDMRTLHCFVRTETEPNLHSLMDTINSISEQVDIDRMDWVGVDYAVWWAEVCWDCLCNLFSVAQLE